jgi:putative ABC transport system permease protein
VRSITPGYFSALAMPLLAGRDFTERDAAGNPAVVIVSRSLAARYWPGKPAVGQRLKRGRLDDPGPWMEVVGVVGSLRENAEEGIPGDDAWYLPYGQSDISVMQPMTVAVKTTKPATTVIAEAAAAIRDIDSRQPLFDAGTLDQRFQRFTSTERLATTLTAALGGIGVLLAAVGVYAVLAFVIRRRMPELGIRASLGARPSDIRALVLRDALVLCGVSLALGAIIAAAVVPRLDAGLFPSSGSLWAAAVIAGCCTALAALISSLGPARSASRVHPLSAMKS